MTTASQPQQKHKKHGVRWTLFGLLFVVVACLFAGRIYLPYWLTDYVNKKINALDGYGGSVRDIDIHLWRGAYQIHGLDIHKTKGGLKTPFVAAKTIDLSIEWKALFHGTIVSEVDINTIALTFAKSQTGRGANWADFIDDLTPFDVNHLTIHGGKVAYVDNTAKPKVNLYINNIDAEVTNLRNVEDKNVALPSNLRVTGSSIGDGKLAMNGRGNILKNVPDFDLDMRLENASLAYFNAYTREAAAIDFNAGTISVYSELAAVNGRVTGYVKPIASNVDMVDFKDGNVIRLAWEAVAATFMQIFKNHPTDQFALRIPVEGHIDKPERDMWAGFWSIFRNAFGRAFPRKTDGNVDFQHALKAYRDDKSTPQKQ